MITGRFPAAMAPQRAGSSRLFCHASGKMTGPAGLRPGLRPKRAHEEEAAAGINSYYLPTKMEPFGEQSRAVSALCGKTCNPS